MVGIRNVFSLTPQRVHKKDPRDGPAGLIFFKRMVDHPQTIRFRFGEDLTEPASGLCRNGREAEGREGADDR